MEHLGGIEPPSFGWKPNIIAVIRQMQLNTIISYGPLGRDRTRNSRFVVSCDVQFHHEGLEILYDNPISFSFLMQTKNEFPTQREELTTKTIPATYLQNRAATRTQCALLYLVSHTSILYSHQLTYWRLIT